jgi:hypothetical protein
MQFSGCTYLFYTSAIIWCSLPVATVTGTVIAVKVLLVVVTGGVVVATVAAKVWWLPIACRSTC